MNYTEPKVIYTCFPGGKHKVLTMSYDDGRLEDRRLVELFNRYGIRGTFNLNGGLPRPERIPESEWVELYKGHEVACHTYHHPTISRSPLDQTARQVLADRMQLEGVMGYPCAALPTPTAAGHRRSPPCCPRWASATPAWWVTPTTLRCPTIL